MPCRPVQDIAHIDGLTYRDSLLAPESAAMILIWNSIPLVGRGLILIATAIGKDTKQSLYSFHAAVRINEAIVDMLATS